MKEKIITMLEWDSNFFGINCGKAYIETPEDVEILKNEAEEYDFISIQNIDNKIKVNKLIAESTNAFLADINIQFEKTVEKRKSDDNCIIVSADEVKRKNFIIEIEENDFQHSKFIKDENFRKRQGYLVYNEWIKNSLDSINKFFALKFNKEKEVEGFILFRWDGNSAWLELVKVNSKCRGKGVCSQLIQRIERFLVESDVKKMYVGTQVNNIAAINLYNKLGFKEISQTSIYHWWLNK